MADQACNFELLGREYLQRRVEAHQEGVIGVFIEDSQEGVLEHGRREAVGQNHMSSSGVRETLHRQQSDLIKTTGKNVDDVAVLCCALGEGVVELHGSTEVASKDSRDIP